MKPFLHRFILSLPVLFLKQYPYAWIAVVALWPSSRSSAMIFGVVVVAGILSLVWQRAAWISEMKRQHAGENGKFYVDEPPIPWTKTARNTAILLVVSIGIAYLLQGQFGLRFWQYFIMAAGFGLFYQDTKFFGAAVTYIITATGIGIRYVPGHLDYRLFLTFREISRIQRMGFSKRDDTTVFARTPEAQDGLLLTSKDPDGFSKRIDKLFIAPTNVDAFAEQLPYGFGKTT